MNKNDNIVKIAINSTFESNQNVMSRSLPIYKTWISFYLTLLMILCFYALPSGAKGELPLNNLICIFLIQSIIIITKHQ